MKTQLLPATESSLALASRLLSEGQLVAFPTETVYGLGAYALNRDAVLRIFAAKGRPADNPLIVHIHDRSELDGICEVNDLALRLMDAFWPGPLTIILPRKAAVPDEVTAKLDTVAVRMPSHPVAMALLRACKLPIAAPSANRSGKPSPTTAQHVLEDMDGRIPLILDGGESDVGLESTVISLVGEKPCILRPGGVTRAMLEDVIGEVSLAGSILRPLQKGEKALSPGMMYKHYAPDGQVTLIEGEEADVVEAMRRLYAHAAEQGHRACVMCFTEHIEALRDCHPHDIGAQSNPSEVAHRLFATLRGLDEERMDVIFSEVVPPEGVGLAIMNRLGRAAAFRSVQAKDVL
ncbi:MAG: L-threonylcarbamoyladenylate synthase [Clostridiales bacterium]|nr:L-threonylcarbamoyladenylate synthase [Clostridiales bacterium]